MSAPSNAPANAALSGARVARSSFVHRLVSRASAHDLRAFVVPGPDVARAHGFDLGVAGLRVAPNPRHANVLLMVGELPEGLREAAAVAYAQMPRPRALLAAGAEDVSPLPGPDVAVGAEGESLPSGVAQLRCRFEDGTFALETEGFEAAALHSRTEYTCSMHPEVVQDGPGTCPKCGMDLVPREAAEDEEGGGENHGGHEGMHYGGDGEVPGEHDEGQDHARRGDMDPEEGSDEGGEDHGHQGRVHHGAMSDHGGSGHGGSGHAGSDHGTEYEGGNVGALERGGNGGRDHGGHRGGGGHEGMGHGTQGDMGFMSMVEMTQGTPRSSDGLQMEWVEAPFGPLFPGLPGGLSLTFTLDGDTVVEAEAGSAVGGWEEHSTPVEAFVERFAGLDPLSPVAYRVLALRAVADAAGARVDQGVEFARVGVLEHERAASHLNWLAGFGYLIGYGWLAQRAEELQLVLLRTDASEVAGIRAEVRKLTRRVERTPLLRRKLAGVGVLRDLAGATGPVARAGGRSADARTDEENYRSLGFEPVAFEGDDALARLRVRLAETEQSLELAERAGAVTIPGADLQNGASGGGMATVETPRGVATLALRLESGEVTGTELETPSTRHMGLVKPVTEQRELGDALVGVASLDLSPWGVVR